MPLRNKAVANRFHLVQVLKMYNKMLEPLLENEPKKVITSAGIWIRQKCYPLFCHVLCRKTKRAFVLVSRESIPEDEPVIFVSTHEFREDVEADYLAAGRAVYVVNGSVSTVMNSFLGIENWAVGVIMLNRADKASRKAAIDKMIYALQKGASIILYPEGTWNKSPNGVISGLFPGVYYVAQSTGCKVVPMAHERDAGTVYSKVGYPFDLSGMTQTDAMELVKERLSTLRWELMELHATGRRKDFLSGKALDTYWEKHINSLMAEVPFYDYELEKHTRYINKNECTPEDAFAFMKTLIPSKKNAFLFRGNL